MTIDWCGFHLYPGGGCCLHVADLRTSATYPRTVLVSVYQPYFTDFLYHGTYDDSLALTLPVSSCAAASFRLGAEALSCLAYARLAT